MDEEDQRAGGMQIAIPKWLPTFADMMTLLMCFFVLLLTFAEMDIKRYQQIAQRIEHAQSQRGCVGKAGRSFRQRLGCRQVGRDHVDDR